MTNVEGNLSLQSFPKDEKIASRDWAAEIIFN